MLKPGPKPRTLSLTTKLNDRACLLLDAYTNATGHLVACPAEALTGIVRLLGWSLKFAPLPPDRWAECLRDQRLIRITSDLAARLDYPEQVRKVCHSALAHEIGHAVLHSGPRKSRTIPKSWEFEAHLFAQCLLTPWRLLAGRPELAALRGNLLTQRERWSRVHDLAEDFQVTASFMRGSLTLYGAIERDANGNIHGPSAFIYPARPAKGIA